MGEGNTYLSNHHHTAKTKYGVQQNINTLTAKKKKNICKIVILIMGRYVALPTSTSPALFVFQSVD